MYLTDFLYDGVKLSSLGYLVGSAVTSNNQSASAGSKLELQTVTNHGSHLTGIVNATYSENITATFDIIKFTCNDNTSVNMEDNEIASMVRWLNRKEWHKFQPIYNDLAFPNVFYNGTFTDISEIMMGGNVVGLTLTFTSNAPYGFLDFDYYNNTINISPSDYGIFYDESDEIGDHYPERVTIITLASGDLKLTNKLNNKTTVIKNCTTNEVINLDCINKIITSEGISEPLVPKMTSMNSGDGEVIYYTTGGSLSNLWRVFDRDNTTTGGFSGNDVNGQGNKNGLIGFSFNQPVSAKYATMCWGNTNRDNYSFKVNIQGSNDGEIWEDLSPITNIPQKTTPIMMATNSNKEYAYLGIRYYSYSCPTNTGYPQACEIQFYGNYVNSSHPRLYNDFNYVYPMLTNTINDSKNIFTSTLPCAIQIDYKPVRKVGIVV